ncbi:MAG: hypothetical protein ACYC35_18045 [Pirellulales bacterium]
MAKKKVAEVAAAQAGAEDDRKAKAVRKKRNKSQAIRDYLDLHPGAGPKEVVAELAKKRVKVTRVLVSIVKSRAGKQKRTPKKAARPAASRVAPRTADDVISLASLKAAKKLADQLGGIQAAKQALDALAQLG